MFTQKLQATSLGIWLIEKNCFLKVLDILMKGILNISWKSIVSTNYYLHLDCSQSQGKTGHPKTR